MTREVLSGSIPDSIPPPKFAPVPPASRPKRHNSRNIAVAIALGVALVVAALGAAAVLGLFEPPKTAPSPGGGGTSQDVEGTLLYQPSGSNYSEIQSRGTGIVTATNGTDYHVVIPGSFAPDLPIAMAGSFRVAPDPSLPGYDDIVTFVPAAPLSAPHPDAEVNLSLVSVGVAAANLTLGLSVSASTPVAYLAFGTYPTFFSNVTLQGVDLNISTLESILNVNIASLTGLADSVDPNLPTSFSQVVVVNQSIRLPDSQEVSGQAQILITPDNVSEFLESVSSSQGSADLGMITAAMNEINQQLVGFAVVSPNLVTYWFLLAPIGLDRSELAGLVTLSAEPANLRATLVHGTNPNVTALSSPVRAVVGVTWDKSPLNASGYAPATVRDLWSVKTDLAVTVQAAAVGISLSAAGNALQGMGYSEGELVSDIATLQNPAVFVLVDPDLIQEPNLTGAYHAFALAIVPNDELTLQYSTSLYLTVNGIVYNTSHYIGNCGASLLPGCPVLVADTVAFGAPATYTPDQLGELSSPTFVRTNGFLVGTTMKTVGEQMSGSDGFSELIQDSPIDIGVYDLGYSNGHAGYNLPSVYVTWGEGPTFEVTSNYAEGLYVPATDVTSTWYLDNFDSYIGSSALGWASATVSMFQSDMHDIQRVVSGAVFNGSLPVPGVLVMMDLWANNSPGQVLASTSGVGSQACISILNLSSAQSCIVANISLSANSPSYVFPSFAQVSTSLTGNARGSNLTTGSCVWIGSLPASCAYGGLACLLAGLCSLSPYHVVNVTLYTCYLVVLESVESCFPPLPLGSVGSSEVDFTLYWGWSPILTSGSYPVVLSLQGLTDPTVILDPPIFPNPTLPGVMDVNETVSFSATVTGGSGGYSYAWNGLPAGCVSVNSVNLTCTPTISGSFSVNVTATDSLGRAGVSQEVDFTVNPALVITAFTASPSTLDVGQVTSISVKTSGGTSPLFYSYPGWPSICLPANSSGFSCATLFSGDYTVNVTVTDATLAIVRGTANITVNPALAFTATLSSSIVSISGTSLVCFPNSCPTSTYINVSASGGTGPLTYSYSGLPAGCSSSNTSSLLCTPSNSSLTYCVPVFNYPCWGWYNVTVAVTDSVGESASTLVPLFLIVTSEPARFSRIHLRNGQK
jgi:hypothetical protein